MSYMNRFPVVLNLLVIAVTVVFVALALIVGRAQVEATPDVSVGDVAAQDYIAPRAINIVDNEATTAAKTKASDNAETLYAIDTLASNSAKNHREGFLPSRPRRGVHPAQRTAAAEP